MKKSNLSKKCLIKIFTRSLYSTKTEYPGLFSSLTKISRFAKKKKAFCFSPLNRLLVRWGMAKRRYFTSSYIRCRNFNLSSRVQWLWHFFRNSICFMCFWFGLEILRLVYKKAFFWNIERFLSYLTFYTPKKVALPLIRVEKKCLRNRAYRVSKEAEFCADFKNRLKSRVCQKEKKNYRKTEILGTWKILQKIVFLRKNLWDILDARVLHIFEISAKFRLFSYPLCPIWRNFFSTLLRDGAVFLEVKRSKKIETVQYFKKTPFYKQVLGFQGQSKIIWSKVI